MIVLKAAHVFCFYGVVFYMNSHFHLFIYFLVSFTCFGVYMHCHSACIEIKEHLARVYSLLPPCVFWESDLDY